MMFYPHQFPNNDRNFEPNMPLKHESPRKKHIDHTKEDLIHKNRSNFEITVEVKDELSYLRFYSNIRANVRNSPEVAKYLVLDYLPLDYDAQLEYTQKVRDAEDCCLDDHHGNLYLNQQLMQAVAPELLHLVSFNYTFNCNFEALKQYFNARINAFFLLSLENKLDFDSSRVLQFLIDLDTISKVYKFIFREDPNHQLKLQWIMNAISKDKLNAGILLDIQLKWEKINLDPMYIRRLLTSYSNLRWKKK